MRAQAWLGLTILVGCSTDGTKSENHNGTTGPRDSGTPVEVEAGRLQASAEALDLGTVPVGCAVSDGLVLENVGGDAVSVTSIGTTDPDVILDFDAALPVELQPGDTLRLDAAFEPTTQKRLGDALTVVWSGGNDLVVPLEGMARGVGTCTPLAVGDTHSFSDTWSTDVQTADVLLVLDTSCSMSAFLEEVAGGFGSLSTELTAVVPDTSFSVASFEDYNCTSFSDDMGGGRDLPFHLHLGQTVEYDRVSEALGALAVNNGADLPEASLEAMYQALTGAGFDQGCDESYDSSTDVLPFHASPDDPFGGTGGQQATGLEAGALGGTGRRADTLSVVSSAQTPRCATRTSATRFPAPTPATRAPQARWQWARPSRTQGRT